MRDSDDEPETNSPHGGRAGDLSIWFEQSFDRVYDVARHIVDDPQVAAEVTRDAFLDAQHALDAGAPPADIGQRLPRSVRTRALNRLIQLERRGAPADTEESSGADRRRPPIVLPEHDEDPDEPRQAVWAVSVALGARDSSILNLHLRHGFTAADLADELGAVPDDTPQLLHELDERLADAIGSWSVWRNGDPRCDDLRAIVQRIGLTEFDSTTAKAVRRHADWCGVCAAERLAGAEAESPEYRFAAVPILVAPETVRSAVAAALRAGGVPISASSLEAGLTSASTNRVPGDGAPHAPSTSGRTPGPDAAPVWAKRRMVLLVAVTAVVLLALFVALL